MIKSKLKIDKRKLNKSGFTLIEVFFSFVVIIAISVIVINSFSKRESVYDEVKEYEADYIATMKAVSKSLLFSGVDDAYNINLTGYLPVTNLDATNELHLVNLYYLNNGEPSLRDLGKRYELFHGYKLGTTKLETERDRLVDDYRVYLTVNTYKSGKFSSNKVPNLLVGERGKIVSNGVYYTLNSTLFSSKHKSLKLNNIIIPENNSLSQEVKHEETY